MWYINGRVESLPLTDMRYINGWVVSLVLRRKVRDFFYIMWEYMIGGNHLLLTSEHTVNKIEQKARKVMGMLKRGVKFTPTQPDVMAILKKLKERMAGRHADDSL
mgnify:CR=1 FL=1